MAAQILADGSGLLVQTRDADRFYRQLNHLALDNIRIEGVAPADDNVDSVYQYLVGGEEASQMNTSPWAQVARDHPVGNLENFFLAARALDLFVRARAGVAIRGQFDLRAARTGTAGQNRRGASAYPHQPDGDHPRDEQQRRDRSTGRTVPATHVAAPD